jgi:hypothetical protein
MDASDSLTTSHTKDDANKFDFLEFTAINFAFLVSFAHIMIATQWLLVGALVLQR